MATTRHLGQDGPAVAAIGYGAMVLVDGMYGRVTEEQGVETLRHAIDAGAKLIDTADGYADGSNEELIGRAIADRRERAFVATKWGFHPGGRRVDATFDNDILVDARPERARSAAEASIRRLGIEAIDLWYLHFPDPGVPIEESVGAMSELVDAGLVRNIGLANVTPEEVLAASQVHRIAAVQTEYSIWTRDPERALLAVLRELGIALVAWSPLGSGFLAGSADSIGKPEEDFRNNAPRFKPENLAANRDRFAPLRSLADSLQLTPAQLALAWLLAQGDDVIAIPGTRTPAHIDENVAAGDIVLDDTTLRRIDELAPVGAATGQSLMGG